MVRDIELAFIKLHILHHASENEVYGTGLIEELGRHGYRLGPGTLYPTLAAMEELGYLVSDTRVVKQKQRRYYRITDQGHAALDAMKVKLGELSRELLEEKHRVATPDEPAAVVHAPSKPPRKTAPPGR